MHRILERFSSLASTLVVLVYLAGLFLGTATYFAGTAIGFDPIVILAVAFVTAGAVEIHSFLSQRLTRAAWQERNKLDEGTTERESADHRFALNLWITIGLVVFSVFNSTAFWSLSMHPHTFADWIPVFMRGLVVPVAFLAAGFLTPLQHDAAQMLHAASAAMLRRTMKITIRQWRRRLDRASKGDLNLAPVAVALMRDAHENASARQLQIIDDALTLAESGSTTRAPAYYTAAYADPLENGYAHLPPATGPIGENGSTDGEVERFSSDDTGPQTAVKSGSKTPRPLRARNGTLTASERQAVGFALLDKTPRMSRDTLRDKLQCSAQEASDILGAWRTRNKVWRRQSIQLAYAPPVRSEPGEVAEASGE